MAVEATVGSANANSYADESYYKDTYSPYRMPVIASAIPPAAADASISVALIIACRMLDQDFTWTGAAVDAVQALTWPRLGMLTRNAFAIAGTIIPNELKNAQCEIAYQLLGGFDLLGDDDAEKNNLQSLRAGSVSLSFQRANISTKEGADLAMRRFNSEFNYLSRQITGEVRRLLIPSWFEQPSIVRPISFSTFGGRRG